MKVRALSGCRDGGAITSGTTIPSRPGAGYDALIFSRELRRTLRRGRRFPRLAPAGRVRCLLRFQDSPILLLRRGFWGLRTLAFMGYYGRAEAAAGIGYAASAAGWEARRGPDGGEAGE
jgi:hypothetical protein